MIPDDLPRFGVHAPDDAIVRVSREGQRLATHLGVRHAIVAVRADDPFGDALQSHCAAEGEADEHESERESGDVVRP